MLLKIQKPWMMIWKFWSRFLLLRFNSMVITRKINEGRMVPTVVSWTHGALNAKSWRSTLRNITIHKSHILFSFDDNENNNHYFRCAQGKSRFCILACKVYIRVNHTWKTKCDRLHLLVLVGLELETFSKATFIPQYSEKENKFQTSLLPLLTIHVFSRFTETQLYRDFSTVWSEKNEFSDLAAVTSMASTAAEETAEAVVESPLLSAADVCEVSVYLNSRHATHNLGVCICSMKEYHCLSMAVSLKLEKERVSAVIKTKLPLKVAMSSLRNLANEATSSAENTETHGSSVKRKRSESNCHQCHRNDKETVVGCTECKKKKYCMLCITKWYPTLDRTDVVKACPACRNICNCAACLKPGMANKNLPIPDIKLGPIEKTLRSMDIVEVSLPFLKQFVAEDNREREEEARIQGLPITGLCLSNANHSNSDHFSCNYCKSSIMDVYRSCSICFFKLCVTCCFEIRDGSVTEWMRKEDGSIVCPPKSLGGCGCQKLELMSRYPTNWVCDLLMKAEEVAAVGKVPGSVAAFKGAISGSSLGTEEKNATLHCPTTLAVDKNDLKLFQQHLRRGDPIIVADCLREATGLSWAPMVLWRACRKPRNPNHHLRDFKVLNCSSWTEETITIHQFFRGYAEGLIDAEGRLKTLKLEDWPPAESFQDQLPRHFLEFARCLLFMHYTHPYAGHLNMSTRLPMISRKLDFGPKMSICYGASEEQGSGSLTMIHYGPSDMVNILMHTATISLSPEQLSREGKRSGNTKEEVKKSPIGQMVLEGQKCPDPSISSSSVEGFEEPEGGAIWDIFSRRDVPKLEEYLRKYSGELKHIPLLQQVHPLHEKAFYLTVEHKRKLKQEYGVEPCTFVQKIGDAMFVPAGCPHQIQHLKSCTSVTLNFVAPESLGECIRLSAERRCLPQNHRCKEDSLQVKQMILHTVDQAVQLLESSSLNPPRGPVAVHDYVFLKENLKEKLSMLEKHGHSGDPQTRANLETIIKDRLSRIDREAVKSYVMGTRFDFTVFFVL